MKGDFSQWPRTLQQNMAGVLQQQGRVLLDSDWNEEARLVKKWQIIAGQDVIGSGLAAVPAPWRDSFAVTAAQVAAGPKVQVTVNPGHAWIDGQLVQLAGTDPQTFTATYRPEGSAGPATIGDGVRDAVILEIWHEALNAFQVPDQLLEPALGGPDTTERLQVGMAFRLVRLQATDDCTTIAGQVQDDFTKLGKLKVTLQPATPAAGDCPVVDAGGYTGFEHNLYRIEIARVNSGQPVMFKWSQCNGGLVGRGDFDASDPLHKKITLTANLQPIITSNLDHFYLEVVEYKSEFGNWQVTYGAEAVLNGNTLELGNEWFNPAPLPAGNVFFRLWNAVRPIGDFPKSANPALLKDGILLQFDAAAGQNYRAEDYWVFSVRAGEIKNPEVLVNDEAPQGVHYHRAGLAILEWNAAKNITQADGQIIDCRGVFTPLTNQKLCCTYTIGDGKKSQGDFNSFAEALQHLPAGGGQLCFKPGHHLVNGALANRKNIRITGCGDQSILSPAGEHPQDPIFSLQDCANIQIDGLTMVDVTGTPIMGTATDQGQLLDIRIRDNRIIGFTGGVRIENGKKICIADNRIALIDKEGGGVAVFVQGEDIAVECNCIRVVPLKDVNQPEDPDNPGTGVYDPCADAAVLYRKTLAMKKFVAAMAVPSSFTAAGTTLPAFQTQGGIQIGSGSLDARILRNRVLGGSGQGIVLGHVDAGVIGQQAQTTRYYAKLDAGHLQAAQERLATFLYDIRIEGNDIFGMGLNGIGMAAYFNLQATGLMFSVSGLVIANNAIRRCVQQFPQIPAELLNDTALGGIVLMDTENVLIRGNRIESNGASHLQPICGIWILQTEKVEIADNHILDNGPRTSLDDQTGLQKGWRGGIVIRLSLQQLREEALQFFGANQKTPAYFQDSIPAASIHDNIVVQPLGHALVLLALGPVSVADNHFTSQGVDRTSVLSLMAGAVIIMDLGLSKDLFARSLFSSYRQIAKLQAYSQATAPAAPNSVGTSPAVVVGAQTQISWLQLLYWPSGQILYHGNRTTLDLRAPEIDFVFSSQILMSLDDVGFADNHSEIASVLDVAYLNTMLAAFSVRTTGNRFQDGVTLGIPQFGYSLFSYGWMNTTMGNQSTNCLLALGLPQYNLRQGNLVLINQRCQDMLAAAAQYLQLPAEAIGVNALNVQ